MIGLAAFLAASFGYGTVNFDGWPPRRYIRNTTSAYVHFTRQSGINASCGAPNPKENLETEACSFTPPNEIYLPNPCDFPRSEKFARLVCHELGHLNGWPENHPR